MARTARRKKLRREDFAGDGDPYTEVFVTVSIRILADRISRSRLAVNVHPDPALERMAKTSVSSEQWGYNAEEVFTVCLTEESNGYEDMNNDFPRIDTQLDHPRKKQSAEAMNDYISRSVRWALDIHRKAMNEAGMGSQDRTIQ